MRSFKFSLFIVGLLLTSGCYSSGISPASESGGSQSQGRASGTSSSFSALSSTASGFSSWGGIAASDRYRHLADPEGVISAGLGINPNEVLVP